MDVRGTEIKSADNKVAKHIKIQFIAPATAACGDFQRRMTPQLRTHLLNLSVCLPKTLSPQEIWLSCLEWDKEAMVLWGLGVSL
jgi:hypothetical protein